jgi:7-cyano-7-deazaguanine synthase
MLFRSATLHYTRISCLSRKDRPKTNMNKSTSPPAVVLLSGGLDSATALAIARDQGFLAHAITFRYGQRHRLEVEAAARVASQLRAAQHIVVDIDLGRFGGSALTGPIDVPKHNSVDEIERGIPLTYVPARNTVFLALALAWSEVLETGHLFIGVNAVDYSGYPDCRPDFIRAFQDMANVATKGAVEGRLPVTIHAPLLHMTKAEIIQRGVELGVNYSLTTSCYDPAANGAACGHCDSCLLRKKGFAEAHIPDPTRYAT